MIDLLRANEPDGAYPRTYYHATAHELAPCPALQGERSADVCIIGAGFTGLSAALNLAGKGMDVVVLEANRIAWGASGRNGGQMSSGQRLDQLTLEKVLGADPARGLWQLAEEAKAEVYRIASEHRISCDLRPGVLHTELTEAGFADARHVAAHLDQALGYRQLEVLDRAAVAQAVRTDLYAGGILDHGAAHLHPLNFALGMARAAMEGGVTIHEQSRVTSVDPASPHLVTTAEGAVRADRVIFAGNGYLGGLDARASRRVMPINNYVLATEPLGDQAAELIPGNVAVADSKFVVNYYRRTADDRLLFGGGESYGYRFPRDIEGVVRPRMRQVFPQLKDVKVDFAWGGTLAITRSRLPYFQQLGGTRLLAGGFSGHGVALATLAGRLMAQYILDAPEGFEAFERIKHRRFPGGPHMRQPLLAAAMSWYALRDRLGK